MAFGALEPCPECKDGQLRFRNSGYACGGHLSGWTTCQYTSKTPKRKPFVIPEELLKYSFLRNYDGSVVSERFFRSDLSEPSTSAASLNRSNSTSKPLGNLSVVIVGKLKKSLKELTAKVEELGGKVVSKVTENVVCVITNEEEIKKNSKKIKDAEKANVHVVSEDFLESVQNGGAALMITQHSLCSWGGDPTVKISRFEKKLHEEKMFTKSIPTKMKMTVKGAAAVEPDSGLEDVAHVYEENGNIYNAILGMVDIIKGTNSYYKLQLLAGDRSHQFWVFRSWGRVGTTIGGNKLEEFYGKLDAVTEFKRLYEEKTGNMWEERNNFVKHPNKFYPLDIDYGQDSDPQMKKLEPGVDSKLPKAVQELICLIFDIESMKRQMTEFELDLKKMPLGKLSKKQIEQAYAVLTELQELKNKNENQSKILDASNRFYTLIPHDFGLKKPPLLDNDRIIKSKLEMLDSLLELEVAYKLLKEASGDSSVDPVTQHYNKLKTDIDVLDESSDEYKTINSYIKNTHAKTHDQYTLKLEEVFKISRHGESKRFKPFKNLPNRYLLWHGSRLTNFAGILSQGLRIAPPEAPSTGYMFGKGIYFADMVSKSANYCYTSVQNPVGLLLLCEVALGNMYERTRADYITKLPPNMHSTKGCGATIPDPKQVIKNDDGLVIPAGKPVNSKISNGDLLYNEYPFSQTKFFILFSFRNV
ncbi:poly [ADP-ribose] polymerase 1-like [Centruroides sculpturatus]|uniref:poly [ADP-ribose] polymerase 1-like n=1 Tax=Centruroides sculpturatus TaxID=218467 RepID=UPI000C6E7E7C|nr:poly [ADP-ribose] polymerase 1-like [Centruroides sculpturatus]